MEKKALSRMSKKIMIKCIIYDDVVFRLMQSYAIWEIYKTMVANFLFDRK